MSTANTVRTPRVSPGWDDVSMQPAVLNNPSNATGHTSERAQTADVGPDRREITFIRPIPGFSGLRRFILVGSDGDGPISELRSVEQPGIRFVVAAPGMFFSDYTIELDEQDCDSLELHEAADAVILTVLTVGRDAASTTANLLAPMVINARTRNAAQVILTGSDWPVRAPLG